MVFLTGDTHGDLTRFSARRFPQQRQMDRDDTVIVCGDFGGVWDDSPGERRQLDWLSQKPFTTCFVDGNHENFDLLRQFPQEDFHGGTARRIRQGVYYLERGQVFRFGERSFFCMGGAASHDMPDGVLDPADYPDPEAFRRTRRSWRRQGRRFRVRGESWWEQELPDEREMALAEQGLARHGMRVDYVVTHCLPTGAAAACTGGRFGPDRLTDFFEHLLRDCRLQFGQWHCGHYHCQCQVGQSPFFVHYEDIVRLL